MEKLYVVIKPSAKGTTAPQFYYTFAENEEAAIHKVEMKWGDMDPKMFAREVQGKELEELVIATNFYG